jgi:hypothetical protein
MSTWKDVGRIALALPEVVEGQAHEGSPAYDVRKRHRVRAPKRLVKAHPEVS